MTFWFSLRKRNSCRFVRPVRFRDEAQRQVRFGIPVVGAARGDLGFDVLFDQTRLADAVLVAEVLDVDLVATATEVEMQRVAALGEDALGERRKFAGERGHCGVEPGPVVVGRQHHRVDAALEVYFPLVGAIGDCASGAGGRNLHAGTEIDVDGRYVVGDPELDVAL